MGSLELRGAVADCTGPRSRNRHMFLPTAGFLAAAPRRRKETSSTPNFASLDHPHSPKPQALSPTASRDRKMAPRHSATLKELRLQIVSLSNWLRTGTLSLTASRAGLLRRMPRCTKLRRTIQYQTCHTHPSILHRDHVTLISPEGFEGVMRPQNFTTSIDSVLEL